VTLVEALGEFLDYARHQQPYLRGGNLEGAAYVGRRLDHAWRTIDHLAGRWVEERYQAELGDSSGEDDLRVTAERARSSPLDIPEQPDELNLAASELLAEAAAAIEELRHALDSPEHAVRAAAVALYLARRSFAAYRVAKYRWFEWALEHGRYAPQASYRWLEA
jgi:hypothetical protein